MKERLIGACIVVALAVIFIPMFFDGDSTDQMVTSGVELPNPATGVRGYRMSLTRNTPPEPISPAAAAGNQTNHEHAGRIDRDDAAPSSNATASTVPARTREKTDASAPAEPPAIQSPSGDSDSQGGHAVAQSGWFVQAGSFVKRANATRLTESLKDSDFNAFMVEAVSGGRTVYRVRVGPLDARNEAEKLAPRVAAASGGDTEVVSEGL